MATRSNVQIHVHTVGDVTLDEVVNCAENPQSPGVVDVYIAPSNPTYTSINRPTLAGFTITGVLIIPPATNTYEYNFGPIPLQVGVRLHPSNPSFISLGPSQDAIYINHAAPTSLTFIFVWV
jgi:hypothetical protein